MKKIKNISDFLNENAAQKLKKGDEVEIIDPNHIDFDKKFKILSLSKHRQDSTITLYEIQNDSVRYFCKREQLKKI